MRMKTRLLLAGLCLFANTAVAQNLEEMDPVYARWKDRVEPAIDRALDYLARAQEPDGSFPERYGKSTGIPSLVGMAFLSKGHTALEGPYAGTLNRCVDYVIANVAEDGILNKHGAGSGPMYAHTISTLFLSEISGMVDEKRQKEIDRVLPTVLKVILEAQAVRKTGKNASHAGGWRYRKGSVDSDTSCSGWALMALRSAKLNGAAVPDEAVDKAVAYLKRQWVPETGGFRYQPGRQSSITLTGMGILCLELCGEHGSRETLKAAEFLRNTYRQLPKQLWRYYGNYYNAQALFQIGGSLWEEYADWMYSTFLSQQRVDGCWISGEVGPIYSTAMMTLAFTVPCRQLPIYQRDESVDEN